MAQRLFLAWWPGRAARFLAPLRDLVGVCRCGSGSSGRSGSFAFKVGREATTHDVQDIAAVTQVPSCSHLRPRKRPVKLFSRMLHVICCS